jgi:hypothetical protein
MADRVCKTTVGLAAIVVLLTIALTGTASAATLDLGCPSPSNGGKGPRLAIKVTKWCGLAAPHRQWQIKVQVQVTNLGTRPLATTPDHVWLALTHFDGRKWKTPGTVAGQRPFKSSYEGRSVWLVPANADGAAESYPPPEGNFTFATHWNMPGLLAPGKTLHPAFHRGDLVFYMPRSHHQSVTHHVPGVVGIAYVDGPRVLVICPQERWGPKRPAETF